MSVAAIEALPPTIKPSAIARRHGCGVGKVLAWIANGELAAIDISLSRGRKPRWRVTAEALENFERRRSNAPASASASTPRRPQSPKTTGVNFFPEH